MPRWVELRRSRFARPSASRWSSRPSPGGSRADAKSSGDMNLQNVRLPKQARKVPSSSEKDTTSTPTDATGGRPGATGRLPERRSRRARHPASRPLVRCRNGSRARSVALASARGHTRCRRRSTVASSPHCACDRRAIREPAISASDKAGLFTPRPALPNVASSRRSASARSSSTVHRERRTSVPRFDCAMSQARWAREHCVSHMDLIFRLPGRFKQPYWSLHQTTSGEWNMHG